MDRYRNISSVNNINNDSQNQLSANKNAKKKKVSEHYLMRGNINTNDTSNKNNGSNLSINDTDNLKHNAYNDDKNNLIDDEDYDSYNGFDSKSEGLKKTSSVESLGFIEMELQEAYNDPSLINELNLNMVIPNLTLAVLQAAITTTNGLSNLYHNAVNNPNYNKNNNKFYHFSNKCQCNVPDPMDLPIINHGKGIMDINDPNGRDQCEDQHFLNDVDELIHELPDSSDIYKDIRFDEGEIGFKDLKLLDKYISGLAKNLKIDDINDNFIITSNEILSRFSNDNLDEFRTPYKKHTKKERVIKNTGSKDSLIKLKKIYESKNVEFCKYPGYNSASVTPLPNNVAPTDIIDKVLLTFKPNYQRRWKVYLYFKESIDIICDVFWLSFIMWYKKNFKDSFDLTYSRLSTNYVKFIGKLNDIDKNEFLVNYSLILSQINYLIYCECFPNSKSTFETNEFKKKDCDLIYGWFVGSEPFEEVWINWKSINSKYIKLNRSINKKDNQNEYDIIYNMDNELDKSVINDIDNVFKKNRKKSSMSQLSSLYNTELQIKKLHKNINNNSPIVSHYIKNNGHDSSKLPYFVQSYEVTRVPKDPNKDSYQQIIEDSVKRSNKNLKNYIKNKEEIIKEKNRGNQETIFYMRKFNKMTQKLLTKPQQVKELCDILCEGLYSNKITNGKKHLPKINSGKNNNVNLDGSFFK